MAPPLTPLGVRASAAASMLAEGVPPEDIGAAAGLANPEGGAWDAPSLARLVDAVATRLEGRASAAAREAAGASRARWAGEAATLSDAPPPWWDPEALGALACALHASDGRGVAGAGPGPALRASDLASIADVLATDLGWRDDDAADLLWCVHTASPHHAGPRDRIDQARVERAAEIALALRHDHAWSVRRCAVALARLLPAPDWDRGGLAGMRAVEGCALLAAALRAGGERGTKNDGGHRSDAGGSSSWWGSDEEEEATDETDLWVASRPERGVAWGLADVASAVSSMLDETDPDTPDTPDTGSASRRASESAPGESDRRDHPPPSRALDPDRSSKHTVSVSLGFPSAPAGQARVGGWHPAQATLLAGALRGGFGWSLSDASRVAAEALGWEGRDPEVAAEAVSVAVGADVGWSLEDAAELFNALLAEAAADAMEETKEKTDEETLKNRDDDVYDDDESGDETRAEEEEDGSSVGASRRTRRAKKTSRRRMKHSRRRRDRERVGVGLARLDLGSLDSASDAADLREIATFLAPACDALAGRWGWSPRTIGSFLASVRVWDADAVAALFRRLDRDWADSGLATLARSLMRWRGRAPAEVAVVARALKERDPGWTGGGPIGDAVGVEDEAAFERAVACERAEKAASGGDAGPPPAGPGGAAGGRGGGRGEGGPGASNERADPGYAADAD